MPRRSYGVATAWLRRSHGAATAQLRRSCGAAAARRIWANLDPIWADLVRIQSGRIRVPSHSGRIFIRFRERGRSSTFANARVRPFPTRCHAPSQCNRSRSLSVQHSPKRARRPSAPVPDAGDGALRPQGCGGRDRPSTWRERLRPLGSSLRRRRWTALHRRWTARRPPRARPAWTSRARARARARRPSALRNRAYVPSPLTTHPRRPLLLHARAILLLRPPSPPPVDSSRVVARQGAPGGGTPANGRVPGARPGAPGHSRKR